MKTKDRPIVWEPIERQAEFLSAPEREVLYGGSLGGGKSDALLACALSQIENPKHRAIYFRRSFPQLRSAIERSHELYRACGGTFNVQSSTWSFPGGAKVEFAFLDSDTDKWRYAGRSFNTVLWDELCEWPNESAYVFMLSRLRTTKDSGLRLEVRGSANPLGVGAAWVRARFKIPDDGSASTCVDADTGFHRRFIPARIEDNKYLAGSDYVKQLQSLPSAQRKALLEGRWDAVSVAIFEELSDDAHVCDPFPIPVTWEVWRSCDDGFRAEAAVLWCCHDRDVTDTIYVIRELHQAGLTASELAKLVKRIDFSIAMDLGNGEVIMNDEPLSGPIDPAAFSDNGQGSRGDEMNRLNCDWKPAVKGPNSRLSGISAIHERLAVRSDGTVGLKFFRNCTQVAADLRALVYDPSGGEDIDNTDSDHLFDSLRYALTYKKVRFRTPRIKWAH